MSRLMTTKTKWNEKKERENALFWHALGSARADRTEYLMKLHKLLEGKEKILDAACGTGCMTASSEKITNFSDGSGVMVSLFNEFNNKKASVCVWKDLPDCFKTLFDALVILGNSLNYATTWAKNMPCLEGLIGGVGKALQGVRAVLKKGGLFLFDLPDPNEKEKVEFKDLRLRDGRLVTVEWSVKLFEKIREWKLEVISPKSARNEFIMHGLCLPENEMIELVSECGFKNVEKIPSELQLEPERYVAYRANRG